MQIKIIDDQHPEDNAMLQALYSRSPASVDQHLEKVRAAGSGKFMDKYYIGYGHASIGDCGSTTLFIEGVSMLTAKAIQDWPLYSGQEASTRYMDFSAATYDDPVGTPQSRAIQERWFEFYRHATAVVRDHLLGQAPQPSVGLSPEAFQERVDRIRAIDARTFDICRAFLPAGTHTNLSWHTNLRQLGDKLAWLHAHPSAAVNRVAEQIEEAVRALYPHSIPNAHKLRENPWLEDVMGDSYFVNKSTRSPNDVRIDDRLDDLLLWRAEEHLQARPRGAQLPPFMAEIGSIHSRFALDFGSFRDLQRHRAGAIRMPLLTCDGLIHPWYLAQLPPALLEELRVLQAAQEAAIGALPTNEFERQAYVPLGYMVPVRMTLPLPAWIYTVELRTKLTVHPTLRLAMQAHAKWWHDNYEDLPLYADTSPDAWDGWVRRGRQDITEAK